MRGPTRSPRAQVLLGPSWGAELDLEDRPRVARFSGCCCLLFLMRPPPPPLAAHRLDSAGPACARDHAGEAAGLQPLANGAAGRGRGGHHPPAAQLPDRCPGWVQAGEPGAAGYGLPSWHSAMPRAACRAVALAERWTSGSRPGPTCCTYPLRATAGPDPDTSDGYYVFRGAFLTALGTRGEPRREQIPGGTVLLPGNGSLPRGSRVLEVRAAALLPCCCCRPTWAASCSCCWWWWCLVRRCRRTAPPPPPATLCAQPPCFPACFLSSFPPQVEDATAFQPGETVSLVYFGGDSTLAWEMCVAGAGHGAASALLCLLAAWQTRVGRGAPHCTPHLPACLLCHPASTAA